MLRSLFDLHARLAATALLGALMLAPVGRGEAAITTTKPNGPMPAERLAYLQFQSSPFPYRGIIPDKGIPFLDASDLGQGGHTAPRGTVYWEGTTYSDRRSLIYFPRGFDLRKPAVIVVFFHGNDVILSRDVAGRQHVPQQLAASGLNAVLLAPQFAVDALDSSAGTFWTPGQFSRYLDEAAADLASIYGDASSRTTFSRMPVVLVAYSGGYDPAAYALKVGGVTKRVKGVVLLDSPYNYDDTFANFIAQNYATTFFFSAYTESAANDNARIQQMLMARRVPFTMGAPARLGPGVVSFLASGTELQHNDFVTDAWVPDPLAWALSRISGYSR